MKPKITVTKLERKESWGDWHDRPLCWKVETAFGIGGWEIQKFITKKDALLYARIRRNCSNEAVAIRIFSLRAA